MAAGGVVAAHHGGTCHPSTPPSPQGPVGAAAGATWVNQD